MAGRKPLPEKERKEARITVRLDQDTLKTIDSLHHLGFGKSKADILRKAVEALVDSIKTRTES